MTDTHSKGEKEPKNKWKNFAEDQEKSESTMNNENSEVDVQIPAETIEHDHEVIPLEAHQENINKIAVLETQIQQYKDQILRLKAETDNLTRRYEREISKALTYGPEKLLNDLMPVNDSLLRALQNLQADQQSIEMIREGMAMTLGLLEKTLTKYGVTSIKPQAGEPFDPQKHEAMTMVPHPEMKSNEIVEVLQIGYELNGRVLRAAMVVVAQ